MVHAGALKGRSAAVICLVLAGCNLTGDYSQAHRLLEQDLRDPQSVQYRAEKRTKSATCGEFNAKNAVGGYVGFRPYVYLPGRGVFADTSDVSVLGLPYDEEEMWRRSIVNIKACIEQANRVDVDKALAKFEAELKSAIAADAEVCRPDGDLSKCDLIDSSSKRAYESVMGKVDVGL